MSRPVLTGFVSTVSALPVDASVPSAAVDAKGAALPVPSVAPAPPAPPGGGTDDAAGTWLPWTSAVGLSAEVRPDARLRGTGAPFAGDPGLVDDPAVADSAVVARMTSWPAAVVGGAVELGGCEVDSATVVVVVAVVVVVLVVVDVSVEVVTWKAADDLPPIVPSSFLASATK